MIVYNVDTKSSLQNWYIVLHQKRTNSTITFRRRMPMIQELIEVLTAAERTVLQHRVDTNSTQLYKFIGALLANPAATQAELEEMFSISTNTYYKNITLAKEEIYDVIKQELRNPYDNMLLPNILYKRGLEVQASKLRIKLEEEYETQGWWNILQEFYNLEMIVAYAKCDVEWLEQLKNKAIANIDRLAGFVKVDREIIYLMAVIEKGDLKESQLPALRQKLEELLVDARRINHPIPVFNTLHSLFVIYTKYSIDVAQALEIITQIHDCIDRYAERMIPYAKNVAWLNTLGFHADFVTGTAPEQFVERILPGIKNHSLLFDSQAILNFCTYHFLYRDRQRFEEQFAKFRALPADKSFAYKTAYLSCLQAYLNNNRTEFMQHKHTFYAQDESRAYTDYELTIRYLDILLLATAGEKVLAADMLDATIKFIRRNFTPSRAKIEKQNRDILNSVIHAKPMKNQPPAIFRLTEFLRQEALKR